MKQHGPSLRNLVTVLAIACISLGAYAEKIELKADLEASSEVPPKATKGHGMLMGTVDTDTDVLTYHITFEDLTGPAAAAHFHGPAMAGENAKPQVPIKTSPIVSPIDGTATLTADQVKDLLAGKWYFNIHTAQNPAGEIRGQVEK
jgi:CHRD domain